MRFLVGNENFEIKKSSDALHSVHSIVRTVFCPKCVILRTNTLFDFKIQKEQKKISTQKVY